MYFLSWGAQRLSNILLIDDDREVRLSIRTVLQGVNHGVSDFDNAKDAMRAAKDKKFDIAIIDLLLPDTDGLELIRQIRANYPEMKTIAISGGGAVLHKNYLPAAAAFGAEATLEKPFEAEALIDAIAAMNVS